MIIIKTSLLCHMYIKTTCDKGLPLAYSWLIWLKYRIAHIYSKTYFQKINETWYESSKRDLLKYVLIPAIWNDAKPHDFLQKMLTKRCHCFYIYEAEVIRHNGNYSVYCVHIYWRKHNGLRFPQSFWWKDFVARFFYKMHSMSVKLNFISNNR